MQELLQVSDESLLGGLGPTAVVPDIPEVEDAAGIVRIEVQGTCYIQDENIPGCKSQAGMVAVKSGGLAEGLGSYGFEDAVEISTVEEQDLDEKQRKSH